MAVYPDGAIVQGGMIPATDSVPTIAGDGCIFENVIFVNPAIFGTGCIFVNCVFLDYNNQYNTQPHRTGEGNVFTDCTFNYVIFGANNVSNSNPMGGTRPNQPNGVTFGETSTTAPATHFVNCYNCGTLTVVHNGKVLFNGNLENAADERKSSGAESSGVCPRCNA